MRKLLILIGTLAWLHLIGYAQTITLSTSEITFNQTSELGLDSATVLISNPFNKPFNLSPLNVRFLNTYGAPAFFIKNQTVVIPPQGSGTLTVYFKPRHNILHQSTMWIQSAPGSFDFNGGVALSLNGQGTYSNTYYSSTQNLKEQALRDALKARISAGYTSLGYNTARNKMFEEIDNKRLNGQGATQNTLECIYTTALCTGYTNRTNAQSMCNFDTEHTFPQGFFNSADPMLSDLYHLFPTRSNANNSRGNLPFGIATPPYQQEAINAPSKKGSNNVYEPHDGQKGATARAMMYFVVRYQDYNNFFAPQENVLRQWHTTYMPTEIERRRNNDIAALQNNRNPFIDYPQFAERITRLVGPTAEAASYKLIKYADTVVYEHGPQKLTFNNDSTDILSYILINDGNQPIDISQITPSDARVKILNANNVTIAPGRAHTLRFYVKVPDLSAFAQQSLTAQNLRLNFTANLQGASSISIPIWIKTDLTASKSLQPSVLDIHVYPNPTEGAIFVQTTSQSNLQQANVDLLDYTGRSVACTANLVDAHTIQLSTPILTPGIYLVKVQQSGYAPVVKKLIIKR